MQSNQCDMADSERRLNKKITNESFKMVCLLPFAINTNSTL